MYRVCRYVAPDIFVAELWEFGVSERNLTLWIMNSRPNGRETGECAAGADGRLCKGTWDRKTVTVGHYSDADQTCTQSKVAVGFHPGTLSWCQNVSLKWWTYQPDSWLKYWTWASSCFKGHFQYLCFEKYILTRGKEIFYQRINLVIFFIFVTVNN